MDLESHHKKPYEKVIIGRVTSLNEISEGQPTTEVPKSQCAKCGLDLETFHSVMTSPSSNSEQQMDKSYLCAKSSTHKLLDQDATCLSSHDLDSKCCGSDLPKDNVIMSVPSALHSKKPPLKGTSIYFLQFF